MEEEEASKSAVHIVGELDSEASASDEDDDGDGLMELLSIGDAPILVGTPHSLRRLMTTASTVLRSSRRNGGGDGAPAFSPEAIARATQLKQHLKTVVIDEADQLLESAAVAQHEMTRRRLSGSWRHAAMRVICLNPSHPQPHSQRFTTVIP